MNFWRLVVPATIAGVLLAGCKGGDDSVPAEKIMPAVRSHDSFAAFLESGKESRIDPATSAHQVVFIGIDGATWRFIDPLIREGKLPNFARLKREGSYGVLRSTPCYMSPPAWTSMLTGYAPEKTGVYTFGKWDASATEFQSVSAADVRVPWAWDVASHAQRKVAVTNVPLTYPVHAVNGIMVSGLMTPIPMTIPLQMEHTSLATAIELTHLIPGIRSFSIPVRSEASDSLNTLVWWRVDSTNDRQTNYDRVVLAVMPRLGDEPPEVTGQVLAFDMGEYSPWFEVKVVWEGKLRSGWCKIKFTALADGKHRADPSQVLLDPREVVDQYTYPAELADELSSRFGYYMPSKFLKQEVIPAVTKEAAKYASFFYDYDDWDLFYYVFTQTDNVQHLTGFSELATDVYRVIDDFLGDLMARLPRESTLIIASDHGFKKFTWGIDLNDFFEEIGLLERMPDGEEIDYERTMVFHNMWYLYFNREAITREKLEAADVPIEPGEDPVDALVKYIQSRGIGTKNPDRKYPIQYYRAAGDYAGDDPDMLVEGAYDDYVVEYWNLKRPRETMVFKLMESEMHTHERDGVFMVWGEHVRQNYDAGTREIEDITPTVLYLLGLPTAADMDGRCIFDVFEESYVAAHVLHTLPNYRDVPRATVTVEKDHEPFEKKLKSLGYVN